MKNISSEISHKISRVNVILSIAIVVIHSSCINSLDSTSYGYTASYLVQRILTILSDSAVPMFFVISAFLTFTDYDVNKFRVHIKKRLQTILIPYLVWSILGWLFYVCLTHINLLKNVVNATPVSLEVKDIVFAIMRAEYNPPIWFLRTLFGFVVISPLLFYLIKIFSNKVVIICVALVVVNILYTPSYSSIFFWLPIYLFGAWCGATRSHYCKVFSYKYAIISLIMLVTFVVFIVLLDLPEDSCVYYVFRMMSPLLLWVALDVMKKYWNCKLSTKFNISFFIFCTHIFIVTVFKKIFISLFGTSNLGVTVAYIMTIVITLAFIWSITIFLKRYFIRIYSFLTGNR